MVTCQIVTYWVIDGGAKIPHLFVVYPPDSGNDVTGQDSPPLDPNSVVVDCIYSDSDYAAIESDPDYGSGSVLFSEAIP